MENITPEKKQEAISFLKKESESRDMMKTLLDELIDILQTYDTKEEVQTYMLLKKSTTIFPPSIKPYEPKYLAVLDALEEILWISLNN
jgi:hypothetical protein